MARGRSKDFDEGEVLGRAMELFWLRGYEGVGLTDLLAHMGISRQSLYDTFGNKRALFLRTLDHYRETQLAQALALLERPGPRVENVKAVVRFFEELASDSSQRGCLVANALVEFGPHDADVAKHLRDTLEVLRSSVERVLREAQAEGELPAGKSAPELSRALTNAMIGLAVTGRMGTDRATLREIYSGTLSMLD